eukprot:CAMPEP_0175867648 /NCGR_PEP_ID=MMETSP0107_2-20121207/34944_1 /TAXON_ID=195067 ORGANISM="Goniomonas pacifica, Strain CCMP1869" /NCGR_SAMPLE_ID=MMETSP0107_2 /ASSEMBLY_ACC=CAM_ASM_000203 /LENGTH=68 /DNA_ID=CAMNT_0017185435 /DNA_START=96 /DNA_END=298 /DNA_ORIENTATION=-
MSSDRLNGEGGCVSTVSVSGATDVGRGRLSLSNAFSSKYVLALAMSLLTGLMLGAKVQPLGGSSCGCR